MVVLAGTFLMSALSYLTRVALPGALLVLMTLPASAQGFKWWQDEDFRRELVLTPEQSTRLEEIFQKSLPTLRARVEAMDKAQKDFDRLVEKADDGAVLQQVNVVENYRAELNKARVTMLLRMRRSLTADQWAKFTALQHSRQKERERNRNQRSGTTSRNRQ